MVRSRFLKSEADDFATDERAWADLCHVLFNGKEFVFVARKQ